MRPTHWKCARCRVMKKLPEEISHADLHAICRECQAGLQAKHSSTDTPQTQQVTVYRRGFQRRHGVDRREPSGE